MSGTIVADVFKGDIMKISGELYKFPNDFDTIKLINKDERRPLGMIILLMLTVIGIPIALILAIAWKKINASVGIKLKNGKKFIASCDASEWKVASKYVGSGSLDSF